MEETYYVYMHYRPNDGVPFNVGKGKSRRAYQKTGRNRWWHNIVNKHGGFDVKFVATDMSEEDSFWLEEHLIKTIGRRDLGTGPLVNMTNGGDGTSGYRWTAKRRETQCGRGNPMYGKTGKDAPCFGRTGEKHPMFGKRVPPHVIDASSKITSNSIWITNSKTSKRIQKGIDIPYGWKRGRVKKHKPRQK